MPNGTLYLDQRFKEGDTGGIIAIGRLLFGQTDVIRPKDLRMRMIRSIVLQPWYDPRAYVNSARRIIYAAGSIGSLNTIDTSGSGAGAIGGNYVRVVTSKVRGSGGSGQVYPGTLYIGSAGSVRMSYIAAGV